MEKVEGSVCCPSYSCLFHLPSFRSHTGEQDGCEDADECSNKNICKRSSDDNEEPVACRLALRLLNCSTSPQLNNETGTEPQQERVAGDRSFMSDVDPSLSGGCLRSSSSPSWTMTPARWQIRWQIGLLEELRLCLSPGCGACSSHTGHVSVFYCSAPLHDSVRLSLYLSHGSGTWQDDADPQSFTSGYSVQTAELHDCSSADRPHYHLQSPTGLILCCLVS